MSEALHEVQVAAFLGYRKFAEFQRALRRGDVPAPDRMLGKSPVWSRTRLLAWLKGDQDTSSLGAAEAEAIRRAGGGPGPD